MQIEEPKFFRSITSILVLPSKGAEQSGYVYMYSALNSITKLVNVGGKGKTTHIAKIQGKLLN